MADDPTPLLTTILACETRVWNALVAGDAVADTAALADGFLGVYPDGFAGKAEHAAQLAAGPAVLRYTLSAARILAVGADHALLSYRADFVRPGGSVDGGVEVMYVSSLWQRYDGDWLNIFSQDTPATDMPPVPGT